MLKYLFDENLRGPYWHAALRHGVRTGYPIDATRVRDPAGLPLGTDDPSILLWAERESRILVSFDRATLPVHLAAHLAAGHHSPGIFALRRRAPIVVVVDFLMLAAHASDPSEWQDRIEYLG
jgi:hypothetical protein